jgi:hypothetical protein
VKSLVTDGLINDNRKVIKAGLDPQIVEKLNADFHELNPILDGGMSQRYDQSPTPMKRKCKLFQITLRSCAKSLMRRSISKVADWRAAEPGTTAQYRYFPH